MRGGLGFLEEVLTRTAASLGYELADFNLSNGNRLLQVFIDKLHEKSTDPNGGITLEDCQRMSDQLQRVLEVEGVSYDRLEVSSPGLDRRLRKVQDFARFVGHEADIRLKVQVSGRRRLVGVLVAVVGEQVAIDVDGIRFLTDLANIERARLVPKI